MANGISTFSTLLNQTSTGITKKSGTISLKHSDAGQTKVSKGSESMSLMDVSRICLYLYLVRKR